MVKFSFESGKGLDNFMESTHTGIKILGYVRAISIFCCTFIFALCIIYLSYNNIKRDVNYKSIIATIIKAECKTHVIHQKSKKTGKITSKTETHCDFIIEYEVNGKKYTKNLFEKKRRYIGDKITIYYNFKNPNDFYYNSFGIKNTQIGQVGISSGIVSISCAFLFILLIFTTDFFTTLLGISTAKDIVFD